MLREELEPLTAVDLVLGCPVGGALDWADIVAPARPRFGVEKLLPGRGAAGAGVVFPGGTTIPPVAE